MKHAHEDGRIADYRGWPRSCWLIRQQEENDGHLTWIIVGLVAGVLASMVMGGTGYGLIGDIIIGIVSAFVGGWLFSKLGISTPFGGLAGIIFVAFIGAVVLLFVLRLIRGATNPTRRAP